MSDKWNIIVDVDECINCYNCAIAVQDEYADMARPGYNAPMPKHGHHWINIVRAERGKYPVVEVSFVPMMCNHCDNAPCVEAAENNAVKQRGDGIVLIDPARAKGQNQLMEACPYGAIWWNEEEQVPQHWNFDAHLIDDGWVEPRCANVCPTGALKSVRISDGEMARICQEDKLEVLKPELGTKPRVYYKNLNSLTKVLVAGTVEWDVDGRTECAANISVSISQSGTKVAESKTDEFGEFKFDGFEKNSGPYQLDIVHDSATRKIVEMNLGNESLVLELVV